MDAQSALTLGEIANRMAGPETKPFRLTRPPLAMGGLGQLLNKARRLQKKQLRDSQVKENYKLCRKRCKKFKCNECWKKTFAEQKECFDKGGSIEQPNKEVKLHGC